MSFHQNSIYFLFFLYLSSSTAILYYSDYDLTYDSITDCQKLCDRDQKICDTYLESTFGISQADCYNVINSYCYESCLTDPAYVVGCPRCDDYFVALGAVANNTADMYRKLQGCYDECHCMVDSQCRDDYVFCVKYLTSEYFFDVDCQRIVAAGCFIPCRAGVPLQNPDRQIGYMNYCYDNYKLNKHLDCSTLIWPQAA